MSGPVAGFSTSPVRDLDDLGIPRSRKFLRHDVEAGGRSFDLRA
jgi:hypothetical protein